MISFFIVTLLASVSGMIMHAADKVENSSTSMIAALFKHESDQTNEKSTMFRRKKTKPVQAAMEKEYKETLNGIPEDGEDTEDAPLECTKSYVPPYSVHQFFDAFLKTVTLTNEKNKLLKIFNVKLNLDKQQRKENPQEYYKNKALCKRKALLHTLLEFCQKKIETDLREQERVLKQIHQEAQQKTLLKYTEITNTVTLQTAHIKDLNTQLAQQKENQDNLNRIYAADLAVAEKRIQETQKINYALIGLTGASIAALAFVTTQAMSSSKTGSSAATPAS